MAFRVWTRMLNRATLAHAGAAQVRGAASKAKPPTGWGMVDPEDEEAMAQVQAVHDAHAKAQDAALRRLAQPIPRPQADESRPDFIIGVVDYRFTNRAQIRVVLGRLLGVPPAAVRLSIAWHGRLPNDFMTGVQKALGVAVDVQLAARGAGGGDTFAQLGEDGRKAAIAEAIGAINRQEVVDLMELSVTKAADGAIATQSRAGQTVTCVADVVRTACGSRAAVCLCLRDQLEWVLTHVVQRAQSSRVDVHVVTLDDDATAERAAIAAAMTDLVDDHARQGRFLPDRDGSGRSVREGDRVALEELIHTPALCVRGSVVSAGRPLAAFMANSRSLLAKLAHQPDDLSYSSLRNR